MAWRSRRRENSRLKPRENDLAYGASRLEELHRSHKIGRVDASVVLPRSRPNAPGIDEIGDLVQEPVLRLYVGRLQHGPREHQFKVNGHALRPEDEKIGRLGVNESDASLRGDQFSEVSDDPANRRRREDETGAAHAERGDLYRKRLLVVDDMMGAHVLRPLHGFGARRSRYDRKIGQLPRELNGDRTLASAAAKDQDRARCAGDGFRDIEPVEHRLPSRDRGQRQSRGAGEIERARLSADDPFVDQMELHVRAWASDAAGVEHFVSRLEKPRLPPGFDDHSGGVIANDLDVVRFARRTGPSAARHLVVDGIDRDRAHLDEKVAAFWPRPRNIEPLQMIELRARLAISDRPHPLSSPSRKPWTEPNRHERAWRDRP